jgi:hypothetical protein
VYNEHRSAPAGATYPLLDMNRPGIAARGADFPAWKSDR